MRRRGGERIRPGSRRKPRAAATRSTAGTAQRTRGTAPRTGAAPPRAKLEAPVAVPLLPLRHPALLLVALLAAAGIVASVSFRILDTDFWQHLLVGKAIWRLHRVPQQHLWTWANYGMPEVLPSWGFRALIWPVYRAFGIPGLFAWRWATTLLAFGLMWATARRMGARGLTPLVILVWCSLVYRHRSQIRPETLAAVLLAIEIWVLELRRPAPHGGNGPDHAPWLVPVAWAWVNSHISYFLFFVVLGAHVAAEAWRARGLPRRLAAVGAVSLAACFLNPFGWRALWQPFDYFLRLRHEPMFQGIGELQPLGWLNNQTNGVFVMLALWPLLLVWRWRRRGIDLVELAMCVFMTGYMASSERFFGAYAVAAAPYLARDLDEWVRARRWPAWTAPAWARAGLAGLAILGGGAAEWARPDRPLAIAVDMNRFPVRAMDFIERHGVRGHGFSQTRVAGYQLWRFWPDRGRLPFMDIHQTGTAADRTLYTLALSRRDGWRALDRGGRFDYAVLDPYLADSLLEGLDADTSMALVFLDDAGALYVRRHGPLAAVADSFGYRWIGGGTEKVARAFAEAAGDSAVRVALGAEVERLTASSPLDARAHSLAATLAISEQRFDAARAALEAALHVDPRTPLAHFRLAGLALAQGRALEAITEFERERALDGPRPGLDLGLGMAYRAAGNNAEARRHLQREIHRWAGSPSARAAEQALSELR